MPTTIIRRLALASATGGILVLAGCSAVGTDGPASVVQPTPISDTVTLSQPFCAEADTIISPPGPDADIADSGCPAFSGYDGYGRQVTFTSDGGGRLLVAVQVADGTPDPQLTLRRRTDVTFAEDPGALAKVAAAPAGQHWVGYRSGEIRFAKDEPNAGDVIDAVVEIPRTDTRPASDELSATIAIGVQVTANGFGAAYPADRAVNCDEDLSTTPGHNSDVSTTTCPEQDDDNPFGNDAPPASTVSIVPTDAQITALDQPVAVAAGSTATVPFTLTQTGQAPEASDLTLEATTSVPNGQATASTRAVAWDAPAEEVPPTTTEEARPTTTDAAGAADPSARSTDLSVAVAVPAGTAAGLYDVTLTGTDTGGSRTATAQIRVSAPAPTSTTPTPAPGPAPTLVGSITLGKAAGAGKGKTLAVSAMISGPGTVEAVATHTRPKRAAQRASNTLVPGPGRLVYARMAPTTTSSTGTVALVLDRTAEGRRAKYQAKTITLRLVVRFTPTGGQAIRVTKNVRVKVAG